MQHRVLGNTGLSISVIGQGTWQMEQDDRAKAIQTLRHGLDLGLTHIDTAEAYGSGRVEELVAEAIAGHRDQVYLASKVLPQHGSYEDTLLACEQSLKRLKTDRLDLYLLHWPGQALMEQTFRAFEQLTKDGKIRAFGVSNFEIPELEAAVALVGEGRIACNQVRYHLQERSIERGLLAWCRERHIAVVGYSPFGTGRFPSLSGESGKVLAEIAEARGATARQVALAFLIREPETFTLAKTQSPEHAEDNAQAGELTLSADEVRRIDAAFPLGKRRTA